MQLQGREAPHAADDNNGRMEHPRKVEHPGRVEHPKPLEPTGHQMLWTLTVEIQNLVLALLGLGTV